MSHIEEAKTQLVFADLPALIRQADPTALAAHLSIALLRQAVMMVATQYQGAVKPHYFSYDYQEQQANTGLALHIPRSQERPARHALPRGIGLVIDEQTGALTFRGDFWRVDEAFSEQIQRAVVQHYVALVQMYAFQKLGLQVSVQEIENTIAISGVSYA